MQAVKQRSCRAALLDMSKASFNQRFLYFPIYFYSERGNHLPTHLSFIRLPWGIPDSWKNTNVFVCLC